MDHSRPQPECLYIDSENDRSLVIERKSVSWPEDYSYHHSKDHDLVDEIDRRLSEVEFGDLFMLRMPSLKGESRGKVSEIGQHLAKEIHDNHTKVTGDQILTFKHSGYTFFFSRHPIEERGYDSPDRGLGYHWSFNNLSFEPDHLHDEMQPQLERVYSACIRKFSEYSHARRILMFDPHGEIQFMGMSALAEVHELEYVGLAADIARRAHQCVLSSLTTFLARFFLVPVHLYCASDFRERK